jgi:hypothetical protein
VDALRPRTDRLVAPGAFQVKAFFPTNQAGRNVPRSGELCAPVPVPYSFPMSLFRAHWRLPRLLLVALLLAGFLARGALPPVAATGGPDSEQLRVVQALGGTICHTDAGDPDTPPGPAHAPDCVVCPLCAALAGQPVILPADTPLPPGLFASPARLEPGRVPRAGPASAYRTAQPRGPPVLA